MPHPAGAGGLPPAGLDGPAELPRPGAGVAAVGARLLLDVERDLATAAAQRVRLVAPLTERARTLRLETRQDVGYMSLGHRTKERIVEQRWMKACGH